MSDQFVAEIRAFPFNFPPVGWAFCNGQLLSISQNTALFSLIGTFYGGDGKTNFALPNLQGAAPLDAGQGNGLTIRNPGDNGGETTVTLQQSQMPIHSHSAQGTSSVGTQNTPAAGVWAHPSVGRGLKIYNSVPGSSPTMSPLSLSNVGGDQAHDNMMPYLALNFCIALQGIFPARS